MSATQASAPPSVFSLGLYPFAREVATATNHVHEPQAGGSGGHDPLGKDTPCGAALATSAAAAQCNAIALAFHVHFDHSTPRVSVCTDPRAGTQTHWLPTVFVLDSTVTLRAGNVLAGTLRCEYTPPGTGARNACAPGFSSPPRARVAKCMMMMPKAAVLQHHGGGGATDQDGWHSSTPRGGDPECVFCSSH